MMQLIRPYTPWCTALLLGALVACGHDAPTRPEITPDMLAHQLDSLATASQQAGNPEASLALGQAALALREGASMSTITIAEGNSTAQYQALAVRIDPGPMPDVALPRGTEAFQLPAIWGLVAWRNEPAGRLIAVTGLADSVDLDLTALGNSLAGSTTPTALAIGFGLLVDGGTLHLVSVSGNAVLSPLASIGQCEHPSTSVSSASVPGGTTTLPSLSCTKSSFTGHFDITFQPASGTFPFAPETDAPTRTFTMARQTVNGIRLVPETIP